MKNWLTVFVIAVVFWTFTGTSQATYDWITLDDPAADSYGHQYALTIDVVTWPDAEAEAVALGGHLVTINDEFEDEWLYQNFHSSSEQVWIGLYQDHDHPDY
jgi:hypothetical protein